METKQNLTEEDLKKLSRITDPKLRQFFSENPETIKGLRFDQPKDQIQVFFGVKAPKQVSQSKTSPDATKGKEN